MQPTPSNGSHGSFVTYCVPYSRPTADAFSVTFSPCSNAILQQARILVSSVQPRVLMSTQRRTLSLRFVSQLNHHPYPSLMKPWSSSTQLANIREDILPVQHIQNPASVAYRSIPSGTHLTNHHINESSVRYQQFFLCHRYLLPCISCTQSNPGPNGYDQIIGNTLANPSRDPYVTHQNVNHYQILLNHSSAIISSSA